MRSVVELAVGDLIPYVMLCVKATPFRACKKPCVLRTSRMGRKVFTHSLSPPPFLSFLSVGRTTFHSLLIEKENAPRQGGAEVRVVQWCSGVHFLHDAKKEVRAPPRRVP